MINGEVLAFALYFVAIVFVGIFFFFKERKDATQANFFLGGRKMGPWVTAMSAQASDMSAWLLMGLPGSILAFGFGQMWIGIGLALGTAANWIFVAKRLRQFSHAAGDAITVPQYLGNRFLAKSNTLQVICAVIFFVCFTIYVASAYVAGASVFTTIFPALETKTAMIIFALAMLAITFFGGFKAVCWTDFFQGLLMFCALLAVPIIIVATQELDTSVLSAIYSYQDAVSGETIECAFGTGIFDASWQDVISGLAWGLGYCGMPHILVRFMAVRDEKELSKSRKVAIVWVLLSLVLACVIGVIGRAYLFPTVLSNEGAQYENVYIEMIKKMFMSDYSLPFIGGLLLCGILAAIMSTADSQLLVSSSAVANDLFKGVFFKKMSDKAVFVVARISVFVIAIIAFFIAWNPNSSIMLLVSDAWAGLGSAFGPAILMSLYWKRTNLAGAASGMISGGLTVIIWDYIKLITVDGERMTLGSYTGIYSLLIGFAVSLLVIVVVSLLTPKVSDEIIQEFEDVKNGNVAE